MKPGLLFWPWFLSRISFSTSAQEIPSIESRVPLCTFSPVGVDAAGADECVLPVRIFSLPIKAQLCNCLLIPLHKHSLLLVGDNGEGRGDVSGPGNEVCP